MSSDRAAKPLYPLFVGLFLLVFSIYEIRIASKVDHAKGQRALQLGIGLLALVGALFIFFAHFGERFSKKSIEREPFVEVDDEGIVCKYPSSQKEERVLWTEINKVQILTTDEGPEVCDVYIVISDSNGRGVAIPQEKAESHIVVDRILALPGFDLKKFAEAMGCSENKWFDVWQKQ